MMNSRRCDQRSNNLQRSRRDTPSIMDGATALGRSVGKANPAALTRRDWGTSRSIQISASQYAMRVGRSYKPLILSP
jgi:hypothetical protein